MLRYSSKNKISAGEQKQSIQLIDWTNPENNDFVIAEEVTIKGQNSKRPDLVLCSLRQRHRPRRDRTQTLQHLDRQLTQLCNKTRFLELIHNFTVFDSGIKKTCRHNLPEALFPASRTFLMSQANINHGSHLSGSIHYHCIGDPLDSPATINSQRSRT